MKKIIILFFLSIQLFATNPVVYSALGDVIYDNAVKIKKLRDVPQYSDPIGELDDYVLDVEKTKKIGFAIERGDKTINKKVYLQTLRELSKTNDFYVRKAYKLYRKSMSNEDNLLLLKMINSGLIDTQRDREKILEYYFKHIDMMSAEGVIQQYLNEDEKLKREQQRLLNMKKGPTKEQIQKAKIERLRRNDKLKQEAIQKSIEQEIADEKVKIRQDQLKELHK
jgi:hypothetical protein